MIDMLRAGLKLIRSVRTTGPIALNCAAMTTSGAVTLRDPTFFLGSGQSIDKSEFIQRIKDSSARVICIGENHGDSAAHGLELDILQHIAQSKDEHKVALSLEFYDRESQTVINEYLQGLATLDTFLGDSRPPANYIDYQPLLDHCAEFGFPVIASNCPRRYTRMVSKSGRASLEQLTDSKALELLPPLPYNGASKAYKDNFISIMEKMGNTNPTVPTSMLDAQSLWDATMAHSIVMGLDKVEKIIHVTGYFHVQYGLGTLEHLQIYKPGLDVLTVIVLPSEELDSLNEEQRNIGDLVVLTDINSL